jgi:hypothetical protein
VTLEELWGTLERRLPGDRNGMLVQRIRPDSRVDLFVTAQRREPHRSLELRVDPSAAPHELPTGTRGIAVSSEILPGSPTRTALVLELREPAAAQLFATLCEDIAERAGKAESDEHAVTVLINRFTRWKRMLERAPDGLSPSRQRGLYGELWTLRELLAPTLKVERAVAAWIGPEGAPRDFEAEGHGVESKTSAANEPQVVAINGERQLDDAGLASLHLVHLSLESVQGSGETLPDIVSSSRAHVAGTSAEGAFDDLLLESGYLDAHTPRYERDGYLLRRLTVLRVAGPDFPRLTEDVLPDGVGSVRYRLAIDACRDHEVEPRTLTTILEETHHRAE